MRPQDNNEIPCVLTINKHFCPKDHGSSVYEYGRYLLICQKCGCNFWPNQDGTYFISQIVKGLCPKCNNTKIGSYINNQNRCINCGFVFASPQNETTAIQKETPARNVHKKIQNWLIALLLIFSLSVIGIGISMFVGSFIPFWILFGFAIICSVEKWLNNFTKKSKGLGKMYRFLLNISILSLLGLLVWPGIQLFSHHLVQSSLVGSLHLKAWEQLPMLKPLGMELGIIKTK
jgi:hypothetical protein